MLGLRQRALRHGRARRELGQPLGERGDTIVEVLIAIAIVSLILTTAYVITNRNTLAIQANQERIEAQHLVEAQIEALRAQGTLNHSDDCFASDGTEADGSDTACTQAHATGSGAVYDVHVTGPAAGVYTISATWSQLTAQQPGNVTMYYRLQ